MSYSFTTLWMNGRFVSLNEIAAGREVPRSIHEESSLSFIRSWLSGETSFSLQTSGSTGPAKPITVSRTQMEASAKLSTSVLKLQPFSNALVCIDTRYIGGMMMIVRSFVNNMAMWILDPVSAPLQKLPVDQCVNFAAFVPYQIQSMLGSKHPHLIDNLDTMIIGGAPLHADYVNDLRRFQCACYAAYGMTETLSHVALRRLNGREASEFYHALPGIGLSLDNRGCLVIKTPYLNGEVVTNDIVELTGDQQFSWMGRADNVINTGGYKVNPEKIEAAIETVFRVAGISNRFFVCGMEDNKLGQRITLVLESTGHNADTIADILGQLDNHLHPYERPKEILLVPAFTLTATQKINRTATLQSIKNRPSPVT